MNMNIHTSLMRAVRDQRSRSLWNSLTLATAMPVFAAYGERSNLISTRNLLRTTSLGFWLVADDILGYFTPKRGAGSRALRAGTNNPAWARTWASPTACI